MTSEEMDAEIARMDAHLIWLCDDAIAEITKELETEKNPYSREFLIQQLESHRKRKKEVEEERAKRNTKLGLAG
jgi:hypothetical protein